MPLLFSVIFSINIYLILFTCPDCRQPMATSNSPGQLFETRFCLHVQIVDTRMATGNYPGQLFETDNSDLLLIYHQSCI